jgi:predicted membrane-bound spermidine synthase
MVSVAWYFAFFLFSGFCSILYELIWLRLAMAQFGVTTPLVSMVLSMFMAGIGLGSWAAGRLVQNSEEKTRPLKLYALCELLIGISAFLVPLQLSLGHRLLESVSGSSGLSSGPYYLISLVCLAVTLIPWCACMGGTIPLAMGALRTGAERDNQRSFSFLYVANLFGAILGATVPLLLIEVTGFHKTLLLGMLLNLLIAVSAYILSLQPASLPGEQQEAAPQFHRAPAAAKKGLLILLFLTGLTTMGAEVVWIRLFTPSIGPMVYSFALILASYLVATFLGSRMYRAWSSKGQKEDDVLWVFLSFLGLLPLLAADIRLPLPGVVRVLLGVMPFSFGIGFLTPMFVDRWSQGDPTRAGRAYAMNVLGCIAGPLVAGFLLLPLVSERFALLILISPFFVIAAIFTISRPIHSADRAARCAIAAVALLLFFLAKDQEAVLPHPVVLRDSTATVIGAEFEGVRQKVLLVNGINMTGLTAITKYMAHLTLASHPQPPQNTLVICFGMGTTFRSALSWGTPTTAVDLIPSVPKLFPYFHSDASQVLASPGAHVVIDDGRRFLERTAETFDSVIIDPPPPVPAAGSSLLYSKEFYALVKRRLRSGGIVQQWLPEGDAATQVAVARALRDSFPYIRVFGYRDVPGRHFLASMIPIPVCSPSQLAERLPPRAAADFTEWGPSATPADQFALLVADPVDLDELIARSPRTPALQDDRPINEYYLLRTPCSDCPRAVEFLRERLYILSGLRTTTDVAMTDR